MTYTDSCAKPLVSTCQIPSQNIKFSPKIEKNLKYHTRNELIE